MLFFFSEMLISVLVWPCPDFAVGRGTDGWAAAVGLGAGAGGADRVACGGSIPGIPPPVARQPQSVPSTSPRTSRARALATSRPRKSYGGCGTTREHKVIRVNPLPAVPGLPQPGRTLVIGVVNVTPDSFSDGGEWLEPAKAIRHGLDLLDEGADILDVGGESTRPGAIRTEVSEEQRRVLPVIAELAATGACISIDTMRTAVAEPAITAGARLINDVSGGKADHRMLRFVAESGVPYICMHWRGHAEDMQSKAVYRDVVSEVIAELRAQLDAAESAGVPAEKLIIDPGLGFAKNAKHNWQLLQRLEAFDVLGRPLLLGVSRKSFLGQLLAAADGSPRPPKERDDATTALTAVLALREVWGVRAHSVRASRDAITVAQRLLSH